VTELVDGGTLRVDPHGETIVAAGSRSVGGCRRWTCSRLRASIHRDLNLSTSHRQEWLREAGRFRPGQGD
jgi:hypothetical protein